MVNTLENKKIQLNNHKIILKGYQEYLKVLVDRNNDALKTEIIGLKMQIEYHKERIVRVEEDINQAVLRAWLVEDI